MTFSSVTDVLLGIAVLGYLGSRQLRWQPVNPAKMWRLPLVLGVAGLLTLGHAAAFSTVDLTLLALSVVAAAGCGAAMGRITAFRQSPTVPGVLESRAGWAGVGVWLLLVATRVLVALAGHRLGSAVATSTGMILLTVALATAATAAVTTARLPRRTAQVAGR